ncbi:hypothetical protein PTKIN_Ptkin17bG0131000 [Pterospermum kingtungense]
MVEVSGDVGTRRRLPLWMQGGASKLGNGEDKIQNTRDDGDGLVSGNSKPGKQSKKASLAEEKVETKTRKRKISRNKGACDDETALPKKMSIGLEEKQDGESSIGQKRKATSVRLRSGKDREIIPHDAACDVETTLPKEMSIGLEEIQDGESSIRRKRKATSVRSRSSKDGKIESPVDDDVELTPEDLVSIAEEYVKADKETVMQEQSIREGEFARQLSTTASSKTESESFLIALDGKRRSPARETTYDSTQSLKCEEHFTTTSRTGDPAQDMLNLFLGPLLKKTTEEKRTEFIANDLTFANGLGKGIRNDVKEETAPLTKKKCTLRDKVAMLLD